MKQNERIDATELYKPINPNQLRKAPVNPRIYFWLMLFITVCGLLFLKIAEVLLK